MSNKIPHIFKSDTGKDAAVSLLGSGGLAVGGMLFTVFVARSISPEKFGIFSALLALAVLLSSLGDLGISAALVNFLPKLRDYRSTIITITFWIQIISAIFFGLLLISAIPFHNHLVPGSEPIQFLLIAFITAVYILEGFAQSVLNAEKKFRVTAVLQIIDSASKLTILALLYLRHEISIEAAFIATIFSALIATLIGMSRELKNISFFFPRNHFSEIFHFSKWIALMRVFSVAISRIDIIILISLSGSFQAGIYAAASRMALLFSLVVSSLGSVITPRFSVFTSHRDMFKYLKKLAVLTTGVAILMLLSSLLAPQLVSVVFGDKYLQAAPVFQALTFAMVPFLYSTVIINALIYYYNKPAFVAKISIIQVTLIVALDLLLIPKFGAFAPVISLGISNLVVLFLTGNKLSTLLQV